jgi:hypothetical protein
VARPGRAVRRASAESDPRPQPSGRVGPQGIDGDVRDGSRGSVRLRRRAAASPARRDEAPSRRSRRAREERSKTAGSVRAISDHRRNVSVAQRRSSVVFRSAAPFKSSGHGARQSSAALRLRGRYRHPAYTPPVKGRPIGSGGTRTISRFPRSSPSACQDDGRRPRCTRRAGDGGALHSYEATRGPRRRGRRAVRDVCG